MPRSVGRVLPLLFFKLFYNVPGTGTALYVVQARFLILLNMSFFSLSRPTTCDMRGSLFRKYMLEHK